ncbi:MAG: hypothetical protein HYV07_28165 [Deltaproteobacteria bacterium]|nr:hypothetical protein [Deltaproteobacteria bacterium]
MTRSAPSDGLCVVLALGVISCESGYGSLELAAESDSLLVLADANGPRLARWTDDGWVVRLPGATSDEAPSQRLDFDGGESGTLSVVELRASELEAPDGRSLGDAASLWSRVTLGASATELPAGYGECGRCLFQVPGPPAVLFAGDFCPAASLGRVRRYTHDGGWTGEDVPPEAALEALGGIRVAMEGECPCPLPPLSPGPTLRRIDTGPMFGKLDASKRVIGVAEGFGDRLAILAEDNSTQPPSYEVAIVVIEPSIADAPPSTTRRLALAAGAVPEAITHSKSLGYVVAERVGRTVFLRPMDPHGALGERLPDSIVATASVTLHGSVNLGPIIAVGGASDPVLVCDRESCRARALLGCSGRTVDARDVGTVFVGVTSMGELWWGPSAELRCVKPRAPSGVELTEFRHLANLDGGIFAACGQGIVNGVGQGLIVTATVGAQGLGTLTVRAMGAGRCLGFGLDGVRVDGYFAGAELPRVDLSNGLELPPPPELLARASQLVAIVPSPASKASLLSFSAPPLLVLLEKTMSHDLYPLRRVDFVAVSGTGGGLTGFTASFHRANIGEGELVSVETSDSPLDAELVAAAADPGLGLVLVTASEPDGDTSFRSFDGERFSAVLGRVSGRLRTFAVGYGEHVAALRENRELVWLRWDGVTVEADKARPAIPDVEFVGATNGVIWWVSGHKAWRELGEHRREHELVLGEEIPKYVAACPDLLGFASAGGDLGVGRAKCEHACETERVVAATGVGGQTCVGVGGTERGLGALVGPTWGFVTGSGAITELNAEPLAWAASSHLDRLLIAGRSGLLWMSVQGSSSTSM